MSQVPLAPPPPTGGPLDGWLYLLWRRLTATGQMLWSSILPGTSADVAAVVTDETGSPGSLVFSGNPTLTGCTVSGAAFTSRGIADNATATALTIDADKWIGIGATPIANVPVLIYHATTSGLTVQGDSSTVLQFQRFSTDATPATINFKKARGTTASQSAVASGDGLGTINFSGWGGSNLAQGVYIRAFVDTYVSTSDVSTYLTLSTRAAATGGPVENVRVAANGTVTLGGLSTAPSLKVTPVASQARWIEVTGATSSGNPTLGVSGGILAISASVAITGVVSTSGYTVATLPAGTVGQRAYVTDALAPAYGVAVAGGGAVTIPVFYNGAAWICA